MTLRSKRVVYIPLRHVRKSIALLITAQNYMPQGKRFGALVWGQSGIGKNGVTDDIAASFTEKTGQQWGMIDCNVSSMTPEDLTGLPTIENGQTVYHPQYKLDPKSQGIFRVDEFDRPAYFQNLIAVAKFAIDRTVENPLPLGWFVLGLANGVSDNHTQELTEHLKGRFVHLYVSTDSDLARQDTEDYYNKRDTSKAIRQLAKLQPVTTRDEFEEHAIYNCRTMEYADSILKAYEDLKKMNIDCSEILLPCLAGAIGKESALMLLKLYDLADLPTLDEVCQNPTTSPIPTATDLRHKYISILVEQAQEDCIKATKLLSYLIRLPNEVARYAIERLSIACPEVMNNQVYIKWSNR